MPRISRFSSLSGATSFNTIWRYCPEDTPLSSGLFLSVKSAGVASLLMRSASDIGLRFIVRDGLLV
ncbi:MAG TPA: hypothetical protein VN361_11005, partial [Oxalicibacterium sp.]|nr:hypothetical protein [Oxalicibacterium sp.]